MRLAYVGQCERNALGNARSLLEVRSKERTHLHNATHLPYGTPYPSPRTTRERAFTTPSIMFIPSAANRRLRTTHPSDAATTTPPQSTPPLGAVNVPISNPVQAQALVQILHVIRLTRGHGAADWHPKAIEKTLFENHTHPAPYPDIVVALTKYAKDSDKRVPSFMFDALADWAPKGQVAPRTPCEDHKTREAANCPDCWSEVKTRMRPAHLVGQHHTIQDTLDTAMSRSNQ